MLGVYNTAKTKMKNLKKKEREAMQEEIANEINERYLCLCDVNELGSKKLFISIMDLLEKRNVPVEVALATLKKSILSIYCTEVLDELGLESEEI